MKKIMVAVIAGLFILPLLFTATHDGTSEQVFETNHASLLAGGWVEESDGLTILHVNGSHYQMGYQHGSLLREQVRENIRAFLSYANESISYNALLGWWNLESPYVPQEYKDEMQGIADGAGISYEAIMVAITAIEYADHGCYGIAAWGNATTNGTLYHTRSFDLPSSIKDPVTGKHPYENSILIIRQPDDGVASLAPSIAGSFHTGGGINEDGVALGIQICWSKDQTFEGNPYQFRVQAVLDHATTAQDAIALLNTNRTHGFNFVVSQASPAEGFALEQTANLTYVGSYNASAESLPPFYQLDHIVRRTNVFLDPTIARTQRLLYDPTGFLGFLLLLLHKWVLSPYYAVYHLYDSVSKQLVMTNGTLELNTTMAALQNGYRSPNDLILRLIEILGRGTGMAEAWNQWTACPSTGAMVVSFADGTTMAYKTPVHYVNFYELLHESPP
jgi:hypothetical protein